MTVTSSVPTAEVASEAVAILLTTGRWSIYPTGEGVSLDGPDDLTMTRAEVLAVTSLKNCGWRQDLDLHRNQTLVWVRRTDVRVG